MAGFEVQSAFNGLSAGLGERFELVDFRAVGLLSRALGGYKVASGSGVADVPLFLQ